MHGSQMSIVCKRLNQYIISGMHDGPTKSHRNFESCSYWTLNQSFSWRKVASMLSECLKIALEREPLAVPVTASYDVSPKKRRKISKLCPGLTNDGKALHN